MKNDILKYRSAILMITLLLLAISVYLIPSMRALYQFENFFPKGDDQVAYFENYRNDFGSDENLLMMAFEQHPTVYDSIFLQKIDVLSDSLSQDIVTRQLLGIHNFKDYVKSPFGVVQIQVLKKSGHSYAKAAKRFQEDPRTRDLLVNADQTVIALLIELTNQLDDAGSADFIDKAKKISTNLDLPIPVFGGSAYTESSYISMLETENIQLIPIFMGTVVLVLLLLYRSFLSILVPTMSVMIGLVLLYGYAAAIGRNINLSTLMYPTIMAVVGMSDLIHLYTKYQQELANGLPKRAAILKSLKELRITLFLTSLTTVIGFLSISWTSIPHIRTFGWDAAMGVGIAYIIAITVTPMLLSYLPKPKLREKRDRWTSFLTGIFEFTKKRTSWVFAFFAMTILLSIVGLFKIDTNNYILGTIDDSSQLKKDFNFFENNLSGIRAFELSIETLGENKTTDLKVLNELKKLTGYLQSWPELGPIFSPLTFYRSTNDIENGGRFRNYTLPSTPQALKRLERWRKRINDSFVTKDFKRGRITAKMKDIGRLKMQDRLKELESWGSKNLNQEMIKIRPTGVHLLMDRTNELMIDKLGSGLLIAFVIISIIVGLLFRNLKMILISLVPNLLPLLITAGFMGYLGVELNGSSAIIFTIAFVIAVDDTIHFLKKYQLEMLALRNLEAAIKATLLQAGKSIITTSVILIAGYGVLLFSDFKEAYYHGVLICLTLFWAVVADLFLLPVLLRKVDWLPTD